MPSAEDILGKPHVYSWSTKVDFLLNSVGGFKDMGADSVRVPWQENLILTLQKQAIHPNLEGAGATGYRFTLEATETACEAEEIGKRLACALLKVAIDRHWGLRLAWPDTPLPCRVIDRTASHGATMQAFGSTTAHLLLSDFASALQGIYRKLLKAPYRLLLSMELCASSKFEADNRTKLILLVSALEALAEQQEFGSEVDELINSLMPLVTSSAIEDESIKNSILGQVRNLKRESSRRAIRRKLHEAGLSDQELAFVEKAYGARSKVVHEGRRVPELNAMNAELDRLITCVYSYEIDVCSA
jgi:hypothetical protein